jgi:hypothetical protein
MAGKRTKKSWDAAGVPYYHLDDRQKELFSLFEVRGNDVYCTAPGQLPDWKRIKTVFEQLGGKWIRGRFCFQEEANIAHRFEHVREHGYIEDARAAGYFPTPAGLARRLVELAGILPGMRLLEPSAGQGAIIQAARAMHGAVGFDAFELLSMNRAALAKLPGVRLLGEDFMAATPEPLYDAIPMNPPFAGQTDIAHVQRAAEWLAPGGRLAAIMAAGITFRADKKADGFRAWVAARGGYIEKLPPDTFRESGTGVSSVLCILPPLKG